MSQELFVNNVVVLPLDTNSKIDCRAAMPQVVKPVTTVLILFNW